MTTATKPSPVNVVRWLRDDAFLIEKYAPVNMNRVNLAMHCREGADLIEDEQAYSARLMDFIIDHIGKPYTADDCGKVLEVRQ